MKQLLEIPTSGTSMLPRLRTGDTVRISMTDAPLRFGDVAAFVSEDGTIVVHRYVASRRGVALFVGDNRKHFDPRVPVDWIIGRTEEPRRIVGHAAHVAVVLTRVARTRLRILTGRY